MKKGLISTSAHNWDAKTLVVLDRIKFRNTLNWIGNIPGLKIKNKKYDTIF